MDEISRNGSGAGIYWPILYSLSLLNRKVTSIKHPATMKSAAIIALAIACVLGVATAQFYGYAPQRSSGFGDGSIIFALIGLFLVFSLFGLNNDEGDTTIIYGNFSQPTGK